LLKLFYLGSEHRLRRIVSTTSVQDLNRAACNIQDANGENLEAFRAASNKVQNKIENKNTF
jgi:hypothetical protein